MDTSKEHPGSGLSAALAERQQLYREMGWWPGEPLLARYLRLSAQRPDALAVADGRLELTHRRLLAAADEYAGVLARGGVRAGDVVLMALPNRVEWQIMLLAMLRLDAVPATIPVRTDAANLLHVTELIGARLLVVPEGRNAKGIDEIATSVALRCSHALDVLLVSDSGELRRRPASAGTRPDKPGGRALDHVCFTSSTTGKPKAVMHSFDTLAALNLAFSERFGLGPEAPIFMASPLGHSVGAYHGARLALFNAAPLVLQETWDAEAALAIVRRHRCAFTAAATPFLTDLVDAAAPARGAKLDSLRWFLCGGAQVPPSLMDRAGEEFPQTRVTVLWGMTEGGLTTCHADSPPEKFRSTCGTGLPGLELRTLDGDGRMLAPDTEGELAMRGPGVFLGYLGQADLYRTLVTEDGFFRTGDLAVIDRDGYVRITGRQKDLIIRGGVNISPVPIEDALATHPDVASVAVIGLPDLRLGERLCAVIEPRGRRPDLPELQQFIAARGLPKYLAPEALRFVDAMPRTPAGKIRKTDLRSLVEEAAPADAPRGASGTGVRGR
ncbi:MAG TPA: AMP-binding protein [Xanthobacteraceae bacterium]|jgi:acyl-CoA synthetase (AMP-forming)/AMP-acid ligase II